MPSSISPSLSPFCDQPQNPTLDRSQSAPAAMEQALAPGRSQGEPGLQELPQPSSSPPQSVPPLPLHSDLSVPPEPSSDMSPLVDISTASQDPGKEMQPGAAEEFVETSEVENSSMNTPPEELSPSQPMEQEVTELEAADTKEVCPTAPIQAELVEMECPPVSNGVVSAERDQPDGDRRPSSDSIPSLAAALKELHELLVSNNQAQSQNHSTSCSPSLPLGQDSSEPSTPTPENTRPSPSTAITADAETSDAKANFAAAESHEEPSQCLVPDLPGDEEEPLGRGTAESEEGQGPPQFPDGSRESAAGEQGQDETCNIRIAQPKPEGSPDPALVPEFREPPEGQNGRGAADGQASGTNIQDALQTEHPFLTPLSVEVGSTEEVSSTSSSSSAPLLTQAPQPSSPAPLPPSTHPFIEQFPAEHIQRIQAAGFSAREAVEALERAHGVVELALLALLARSITVPT